MFINNAIDSTIGNERITNPHWKEVYQELREWIFIQSKLLQTSIQKQNQ